MTKRLSPLYLAYMKSPRWHAKRRRYFAHADTPKCCQGCGAVAGLDLHHRTYERFRNESLDDLVPVCRACHDAIHDDFNSRLGGLAEHTNQVLATLRLAHGLPQLPPRPAPRPRAIVDTATRNREKRENKGKELAKLALSASCSTCNAQPGRPCVDYLKGGKTTPRATPHAARFKAAKRVGAWERNNPRPPAGRPISRVLTAHETSLELRRAKERQRNGL